MLHYFQPIDTALIEDKGNINSGGLKTMNNCLQLAGKHHAGWPSLNEKPSSTARRLPAGPLPVSLKDDSATINRRLKHKRNNTDKPF